MCLLPLTEKNSRRNKNVSTTKKFYLVKENRAPIVKEQGLFL